MFKKLGQLFVWVLGMLLLVYSATRSLDFISMTLPADRQVLAYFGLAALDGGLLAWLAGYRYGSHGGWQRGIALILVVIDLVGACVMFTADTLYNSGKMGLTATLDEASIQMIVLALSGVIGLNIAAVVAHHLTEPDAMKQQAEEEAFAKIEDKAMKAISDNSDQLAAVLAPQIADDWMRNTRAKYEAALGSGSRLSLPAERGSLLISPAQRKEETIFLNAETVAAGGKISPQNGASPNGSKLGRENA